MYRLTSPDSRPVDSVDCRPGLPGAFTLGSGLGGSLGRGLGGLGLGGLALGDLTSAISPSAAFCERPGLAFASALRAAWASRASAIASVFFLCGPRTMIMFRPSCFGFDSTNPRSSTSEARRCSSR